MQVENPENCRDDNNSSPMNSNSPNKNSSTSNNSSPILMKNSESPHINKDITSSNNKRGRITSTNSSNELFYERVRNFNNKRNGIIINNSSVTSSCSSPMSESNDSFNIELLMQMIEKDDGEYLLKLIDQLHNDKILTIDDKINQSRINNKFLLLIYNIKQSDYYNSLFQTNNYNIINNKCLVSEIDYNELSNLILKKKITIHYNNINFNLNNFNKNENMILFIDPVTCKIMEIYININFDIMNTIL